MSIKNKITAPELIKERDNCNFDKDEFFTVGNANPETVKLMKWYKEDRDSDPKLRLSHNSYEETTKESQFKAMQILNHLYFRSPESREKYFYNMNNPEYQWEFMLFHQLMPVAVHKSMFL